MYNLLLIIGRGIGQVMFQNNALSGLFMLIGIFLNSWQMGLLALLGNVISNMAAYFSGYKQDDIKNGLYGFNGTLVGIAVGAFLQLSVESFILLVFSVGNVFYPDSRLLSFLQCGQFLVFAYCSCHI